jgi:alpha-tubulin suppressor-like RCC1 family protein
MQSLTLPVDSGSDLALNTRRSVFQGFSNAIRRLNKTTENAMKRLFKKETSVQGRLVQVNSNASQSMRSSLGFSNVANRLNATTTETTAETLKSASLNQMLQTTTATSASSNNAASLNVEFASAEFIPVEFASVKFTPPLASFSSKLTKFVTIAFVSLFLVGCGESGGESGNKSEKNESVSDPVLSSAKDITGFSFSSGVIRQTVIDGSEINVTIDYYSTVPSSATNPTPIVTHTGVSYSPTEAISTFGTPVTYTVTAEDDTTKDYQALVKRAIVVNDESDLLNAFDAIAADSSLTQIDLLITSDITLSSSFTIPSEWSSKGVVIENNSSESEVTITGLTIEEASAVKLVGAKAEALPAKIVDVGAGDFHSLALSSDGKIYATGSGRYLSMCVDFNLTTFMPATLPEGVKISSISVGTRRSYALDSDGKVYVALHNIAGTCDFSDNYKHYDFTPVTFPEGVKIKAVVSNGNDLDDPHSLALSDDGKVYAYGWNRYGQLGLDESEYLGDGDPIYFGGFTPVTLPDGVKIKAIATGSAHSLALDSDGKVYATGGNYVGQLGLGESELDTNRTSFTLVPSLNDINITAISAGGNHSLALDSDGKVYATGGNYNGQLGLGDYDNRSAFTPVTFPEGVIITSIVAGSAHSLALDSDGKIYGTGRNDDSRFGFSESAYIKSFTPIPVPNGVKIKAIAAGWIHSVALDSDGKVYATGHNGYGELGLGDNDHRNTFTEVTSLSGKNITVIIVGSGSHSFALAKDRKVYAAGHNDWRQLGLGDNDDRDTFTEVTSLSDKNIKAMVVGEYYTLALSGGGAVYAIGGNVEGQLGLGDTINRASFTRVTSLDGKTIKAIAVGVRHSFAFANDGKVYATGFNYHGQLGLGDSGEGTERDTFTEVTSLSGKNIKAIAAGYDHSFALDDDGKVYATGSNVLGELGLGDSGEGTDRNVFTPVPPFIEQ